MTPAPLAAIAGAVLGHALDRVPGIVLALPLLAAASLVFAATRHEDVAVIRRATVEWFGWLAGVLGAVLAAVVLLAWLA